MVTEVDTKTFQSPCGEDGLKDFAILTLFVDGEPFQSPCGEDGLKDYGDSFLEGVPLFVSIPLRGGRSERVHFWKPLSD
jgi:hypothetical protein